MNRTLLLLGLLSLSCAEAKPKAKDAIPVIKKDPKTGKRVAVWPDEPAPKDGGR